MLRFDRYLPVSSRVIDLATGRRVSIHERIHARRMSELFESRSGHTLIDLEHGRGGRLEVWEAWKPRGKPRSLAASSTGFIEMLECARLGAPRRFDVKIESPLDREYVRRAFAREARLRGWIAIDIHVLTRVLRPHTDAWPYWLADRSLVVFAEGRSLNASAMTALRRLAARDGRPHVVVRLEASTPDDSWDPQTSATGSCIVREQISRFEPDSDGDHAGYVTLETEAAARWALLLDELTGGRDHDRRAIDLANVLMVREQPFEAGALLVNVTVADDDLRNRRESAVGRLAGAAATRAAEQFTKRTDTTNGAGRRWEMMDDFVGVLQLCQDVEDEQTALSRVGAFLRDRLQASTVAFVVREQAGARVLSRVGSEAAGVELAVRSIDTGIPIPAADPEGPVESAHPVRHASEVIGAVWCRWSAGTPVATEQAATLLGIAATAAAPSVRLAIARHHFNAPRDNPIPELVGVSAAMASVREAIHRAAASPFPVLIEGESGSGKELAARAIHARSVRRDRRLCTLNCAALVDELVEAELFGHTRGAFTGATTERRGVFEEASGGTLFLDEVAELGPRVQAKLLRTLQEGEIRRLGEPMVRRVDVRIVAATNRPLAREVEANRFRRDLWYRLDVIRIPIPALRERLEDVAPLAQHVWQALAARANSRAVLSQSVLAALAGYDWPGNVRELQNVLASVLVSSPKVGVVRAGALPAHIARAAAFEATTSLEAARRQFEERYVRAALARSGWRVTRAARELGLSRQGFSKLLDRLNIERPRL